MRSDLDDHSLAVVRRGYDRGQVDELLAELRAELHVARTERVAATEEVRELTRQLETGRDEVQETRVLMAQARSELDRLRTQVVELSAIPTSVDGMSERLQQMVRITQEEMHEMRGRATAGATQVLTLAQAEADELRERSRRERADFEAEQRTVEEDLRVQVEQGRERLEALRVASEGEVTRLEAELAERRRQAEEELGDEIDARRTAVSQELAALEKRRGAEAARILDSAAHEARNHLAEATTEAQRIRLTAQNGVADSQRELEDLRALQHQVSEQLTSVRALLDWTLPHLSTTTARMPLTGAPGIPSTPAALGAAPAAPAPVRSDPVQGATEPDGRDEEPGPGGSGTPVPDERTPARSGPPAAEDAAARPTSTARNGRPAAAGSR